MNRSREAAMSGSADQFVTDRAGQPSAGFTYEGGPFVLLCVPKCPRNKFRPGGCAARPSRARSAADWPPVRVTRSALSHPSGLPAGCRPVASAWGLPECRKSNALFRTRRPRWVPLRPPSPRPPPGERNRPCRGLTRQTAALLTWGCAPVPPWAIVAESATAYTLCCVEPGRPGGCSL